MEMSLVLRFMMAVTRVREVRARRRRGQSLSRGGRGLGEGRRQCQRIHEYQGDKDENGMVARKGEIAHGDLHRPTLVRANSRIERITNNTRTVILKDLSPRFLSLLDSPKKLRSEKGTELRPPFGKMSAISC